MEFHAGNSINKYIQTRHGHCHIWQHRLPLAVALAAYNVEIDCASAPIRGIGGTLIVIAAAAVVVVVAVVVAAAIAGLIDIGASFGRASFVACARGPTDAAVAAGADAAPSSARLPWERLLFDCGSDMPSATEQDRRRKCREHSVNECAADSAAECSVSE
jgi:hypothetical protein